MKDLISETKMERGSVLISVLHPMPENPLWLTEGTEATTAKDEMQFRLVLGGGGALNFHSYVYFSSKNNFGTNGKI